MTMTGLLSAGFGIVYPYFTQAIHPKYWKTVIKTCAINSAGVGVAAYLSFLVASWSANTR